MSWNPDLYQKALNFAAKAHQKQHIPGGEIPYVTHVCNVCMEAVHATLQSPKEDIDLVMQCALLHDTIEDTEVKYEDVARVFGQQVADGVLALTKDFELPKEEQMADSLKRILEQPAAVRIVKMADRINNLSDPPHYWTKEKRQKYQIEASLILEKLGGVNAMIENRLFLKIQRYSDYIK